MSILNIEINHKKEDKWDTIHPITKAKNVITDNSKTVQEELNLKADDIDVSRETNNKSTTGAINELKSENKNLELEINKRYLKTETLNKEQIKLLIEQIVGTAPEALDTLKEIADALNNDPNFAATMTSELSKKVNTIEGKQLSDENFTLIEKNKLSLIEEKANNYIHPTSHNVSIIKETIGKQFVSLEDKQNWNSILPIAHEHSNKSIIDTITEAMILSWNEATKYNATTIKTEDGNSVENKLKELVTTTIQKEISLNIKTNKILIEIPQYNKDNCFLQLFANGILLYPSDYTISEDSNEIIKKTGMWNENTNLTTFLIIISGNL